MPLTFQDIALFVTHAPPEMFQGSPGQGMREYGKAKMEHQDKQAQNALNLKKLELDDQQARAKTSFKDQQGALEIWRKAQSTGDPDTIEQAAQELERVGFKVQRPEHPTKAETSPQAELAPELGVGLKTPPPAESDARIDAALAADSSKVNVPEQERRLTLGMGLEPPSPEKEEVTTLAPEQEQRFRKWASDNKISDVDNPQAHYDYRGFWLQSGGKPVRFGIDHFPDTFKQHGHPTFSTESEYSTGPEDGGTWDGENYRPQAQASAGKGSREWQVYGPDGKLIYRLDSQQLIDNQRARAREAFQPLKDQAASPEDRRAAEIGERRAENSVGKVPIDKALDTGEKAYEFESNKRYKRDYNKFPPGYGNPKGQDLRENKFDADLLKTWHNEIEGIVKDSEGKYEIQKKRAAIEAGDKVSHLARGKDPLSQRAALTANLKQMFSSVTSDRELDYTLNSAGLSGRVEQAMNDLDRGQLTDNMLRQMIDLAEHTSVVIRRHVNEAGEATRQRVRESVGLMNAPEDVRRRGEDYGYGSITGTWGSRAQGGGGAPAPKAPATGRSSDPNAEAEDLLK